MFHDVASQVSHAGIIISPWTNVVAALQHLLSFDQTHIQSLRELDFLEGVLLRARDVLIHNLVWQHVFTEPDCPSVLLGLAVNISIQDRKQEIFCLELKSPRYSRNPEIELTQAYGFQRAITSGIVEIRYRAHRPNLFKIDFVGVAEVLKLVFPTLEATGHDLVEQLRNPSSTSTDPNQYPISIFQNKELRVMAWLQNVAPRFSSSPEVRDTWQFDGAKVSGPLWPNGSIRTTQLPQLQIQILPIQVDPNEYFGWRRFATAAEWANVINLTSRIAREFRSQTMRNRWSDAKVR